MASSNGAYNANPELFKSDVVVGFEKGIGNARYAWSHDKGSNFMMAAASGLQYPSDVPSDSEDFFNIYEGSPVPVSFHQAQGPSMPKSRHFVMVAMAGSDSHGLSLNNGTYSTDIFGLVSIDGGETFKAPVRLNSKVGGPATRPTATAASPSSPPSPSTTTGSPRESWRSSGARRSTCARLPVRPAPTSSPSGGDAGCR